MAFAPPMYGLEHATQRRDGLEHATWPSPFAERKATMFFSSAAADNRPIRGPSEFASCALLIQAYTNRIALVGSIGWRAAQGREGHDGGAPKSGDSGARLEGDARCAGRKGGRSIRLPEFAKNGNRRVERGDAIKKPSENDESRLPFFAKNGNRLETVT
jgi:hypothetical protein